MPKATSRKPKGPQTVVDDIYTKLGSLLLSTEFRTSAQVIDAFEHTFPDDWKTLVSRFGHRDDTPGKKNRGHYYAASTYLADRLAAMKRMGYVELKYVTDGYDQTVWRHNRRMGTWRLTRMPAPTSGEWKFLTVRVAGDAYERLVAESTETNVSVAARAASRSSLVCTLHIAKFLRELEYLAVAITEAKRLGDRTSGNVKEAILGTQTAVEDAREEMNECRDCRTRYQEMKAVADAVARRSAAAAGGIG